MSRKNCLFIMSVFCLFWGCSSNKVLIIDEDVEPIPEPEQYFLPNNDGYIYLTNEDYLQRLYSYNYKETYSSYDAFRTKAIKGHINLNYLTKQINHMGDSCEFYYYEEKFKQQDSVMVLFQTKGIEKIKERYLHKSKNHYGYEYAYNVRYRDVDERLTVAYCMWLSGYVYRYGDFEGTTYFEKKTK